jgi:methyl-accepting chemotaxis protein
MSDMVSRMRGTAGSLQAATGEILAGANDLSERTTRQAATIEQTSAAMESLAATVASNSKEAEFASIKATEAAKGAEAGEAIMQQASSAIARISDSSGRISNIIAVIDNIAFQTNLLALNASVEAARAGDAGGGFAVVAAEVRRLAQSAASQSAEVKALIETSIREVSNGVELVQQATEALAELRRMVIESATATQSIAAASSQQATALAEINIAVRQMDEMTQHNAALVEETNAAIEQTESQAADLNSVVATFQMSDPVRPQRGATLHFLAAS